MAAKPKPRARPRTNHPWFKDRMEDAGWSQRRLAKEIGLDSSGLSRVLSGSRKATPTQVHLLAKHLARPVSEIEHHLGITASLDARTSDKLKVRIVGEADEHGAVRPVGAGSTRVTVAPPDSPAAMEAIRVTADGSPMDGWLVYFTPTVRVDPRAVGRLAVVESAAERKPRRYVGILRQARDGWTIAPLVLGAVPARVRDIDIAWAAPVSWVMT